MTDRLLIVVGTIEGTMTTASDTLPERNEEYATREYWYASDASAFLFLIIMILLYIRDQRYAQ